MQELLLQKIQIMLDNFNITVREVSDLPKNTNVVAFTDINDVDWWFSLDMLPKPEELNEINNALLEDLNY